MEEEEDEPQNGKQHPWQTVTKTDKSRKSNPGQYRTSQDNEQFQALTNTSNETPKEENNSTNHTNNDKPKDPKPPPIYVCIR
jgi:hypothetical protein